MIYAPITLELLKHFLVRVILHIKGVSQVRIRFLYLKEFHQFWVNFNASVLFLEKQLLKFLQI